MTVERCGVITAVHFEQIQRLDILRKKINIVFKLDNYYLNLLFINYYCNSF